MKLHFEYIPVVFLDAQLCNSKLGIIIQGKLESYQVKTLNKSQTS